MKPGGYLYLDHRASPGLPEDIARASGYDPKLCKEGKLFEADTLTCSHCKVCVVKNPLRTRARPHCLKCNHYICDLCEFKATLPDYTHTPWDKAIDLGLDSLAKSFYCDTPIPLLRVFP